MTKKELLELLGTVDSIEAGAVMSFVMSLPITDPRFETLFEGKAKAAIGFWLKEEEKAKLSELLTCMARKVAS